jgi:hypothetical protein
VVHEGTPYGCWGVQGAAHLCGFCGLVAWGTAQNGQQEWQRLIGISFCMAVILPCPCSAAATCNTPRCYMCALTAVSDQAHVSVFSPPFLLPFLTTHSMIDPLYMLLGASLTMPHACASP